MKKILASALLVTLASAVLAPAHAGFAPAGSGLSAFDQLIDGQITDKRKPRVPGGSGCDTPKDVAQHPECQV
jgi:hypothetical protein